MSTSDPANVLVLGGTGHIGAAIARAFAGAGHTVSVTGLSARPRPNLDGVDVTILSGDDRDPATIKDWCTGRDVIVDAATPYPVWLHNRDQRDPVGSARRRSTQIVQAAKAAGASFIHISSFTTLPRKRGVLGQVGSGLLQGLHSYFAVKIAAEEVVMNAFNTGLSGCVINPATCFGPYDLKPRDQTFIPMLLSGEVKGLVNHVMNVVDVRDVGAIALASVQRGYPHRQVPVYGHDIDLSDLARAICALGQRPAPTLKVPSAMGLAGLYWAETAFALAGRKTPWPSLPMMLLQASYAAPPSAAQTQLHPKLIPLRQTLQDATGWYAEIGAI